MSAIPDRAVPLLDGLSAVADGYDALFCDVWGVVHDGVREYAAAGEALEEFRARGGTVVLVTNAPVPNESVARVLARKQVRRSAWDAIVASGDVTRGELIARGEKGVFYIGPDRDHSLLDDLPVSRAPLEHASVAVVTGLHHEDRETEEDYRDLLARMRERGLALICANPDRHVHVGEQLIPCAGLIGDLYESMGGEVVWAGKPYEPIYDKALTAARRLRPSALAKDRILMIGDSIRTDLAGAAAFGVDALFIARGLHRDDLGAGEEARSIATLLRDAGASAIGAMPSLRW